MAAVERPPRWQAEGIFRLDPALPVPAPALPALPVVETFHSLQGEGVHAGRSAFFIRLAGCDVGCPWCDTKHSWPEAAHPRRPLGDLVAEATAAAAAGAAFVVITGGEPLQQPLDALCAALAPVGLPLHLETSGVGPFSGCFDWITLSPKRHRPPVEVLLRHCHELKVVVHEPADLGFADAMARAASLIRRGSGSEAPVLLLQPGWQSAEGQSLAIDYVQSHPAWRLGLQLHKGLGVR
ncbi:MULTISPECIES: 7-carboxy-7-deazaguanine synthase QueE [unclassified Cyanobium]|uniref:7-carboxy-7-deazaguanine synthase QueE n=1 Tax=unclassified Cyanobium TaxID=2627006 RepID=UPI0020CDAC2A|nr:MULTISPECIES: 7-carboxy-7-deazaguanine synthase QueE [unclassified Cyanobium]MCP9835382.1 7-carboxy-7-deazaguanine synthase QueE [Cyanobium sp. La Preciosa 7G6]MCP9938100.1 7-carboxy-7-deazaguanine synthase QueE [Cyanobium sp. Aljojuca 7A6]